jgi:hypothetical protein
MVMDMAIEAMVMVAEVLVVMVDADVDADAVIVAVLVAALVVAVVLVVVTINYILKSDMFMGIKEIRLFYPSLML